MNLDHSLIAGVLESRDLGRAVRAGATVDLLTEEAVTMWNLILAHEERFHEVPSVDFFKELYPPYEHVQPENAVEVIVHELKTRKLGNEIQQAVQHLLEVNAVDPWKAKDYLVSRSDEISTKNQVANTRMVLGEDKDRTLALLDSLARHEGLIGYPWPWDWLNDRTTGLRDGNLVYVYGREKSKKTFLTLFIALFLWSHGLKVLYFTREMTREEIAFVAYCMIGGIDIDRYKKGELTTAQKEHLASMMDLLRESGRFIVSENDQGIAGFKAEIEEVNPHVVVHDCWKSMADDAMGDKVGDESRYVAATIEKVKKFAMKRKVPIILVGHANREGEKSKGRSGTEHAWSDNIVRRVDLSLRVVSDDAQNRLAIIINRARGMKQGVGFTVSGKLCDGFGTLIENNALWVDSYDEADREEEEASHARTQKDKLPQGMPTKFTPASFSKPSNFQRR